MSGRDDRPFVVVGGGIGGLAAALALGRAGFPVRVLERAEAFGELGAGIQVGPNFVRALAALGVRERVLRDAWRPPALEMRCAVRGITLCRFEAGERLARHFGEPYLLIHRADLHGALLEAVESLPGVALETGMKVVAVEQDGEGAAALLADGRRVEGRAVVGCDGLWSTVRRHVLDDGEPVRAGHIAYRAVLRREEVPEDLWRPEMMLWAGPRTHLVHYPLHRGELYNLVAVFHSRHYEEGWNLVGDPALLWEHFRGQRPEVLRLLERIETWRFWVLCDREPACDWSKGRVVLLGDAAHPMLQYLAQGAAMATEDAVRLAREVTATPDDLPAAFERYWRARYLRTARVQLQARFFGEIYHAHGAKGELRDALVGSATTEGFYANTAWLYGGDDTCWG